MKFFIVAVVILLGFFYLLNPEVFAGMVEAMWLFGKGFTCSLITGASGC